MPAKHLPFFFILQSLVYLFGGGLLYLMISNVFPLMVPYFLESAVSRDYLSLKTINPNPLG